MADEDPSRGDLASDRTDLAEDRTAMANERTFAGWARTGMAAIGIGLGFNALFSTMQPDWAPRAIATIFILLGVVIVIAAERRACASYRRLDTHSVTPAPRTNLRLIAWAIAVAGLCLAASVWVLA